MLNKTESGQGTIIGANVKLTGALRDVNDITIHGAIDGEVSSEKGVTIGETAHVKGPVTGVTVSVAGTIRGSIEAINSLELLPTGKVFGNITAQDLIIRSGATFVGKCTMPTKDSKEERSSVESSETEAESKITSKPAKPEYEVE